MITFVDRSEYYAGMHRSGWKYVIDCLMDGVCRIESDILFDSVLDVNTNVYTKPWIGCIHHTFDKTFEDNCMALFSKPSFLYSLRYCKALITLTNHLRDQVLEELYKLKLEVPVYAIIHPTDFNCPKFTFATYRKKVVQIGGWLRNPFGIYALQTNYGMKKYVLIGPRMEQYFPQQRSTPPRPRQWLSRSHQSESDSRQDLYGLTHNTFYKYMEQYIEDSIKSVKVIEHLDNHQYDRLLSESIVFINLIDCSAVNTIIECIVRNTPVIVNFHPALVEVLGIDYPGFYWNMYQASTLVNSPLSLYRIYIFLHKMDKTHLKIDTFIDTFNNILGDIDQSVELQDAVISEDCAICIEPIIDDLYITRCNHIFHNTCIQRFLSYDHYPRCPICRNVLRI
jgi:hypothetical protein